MVSTTWYRWNHTMSWNDKQLLSYPHVTSCELHNRLQDFGKECNLNAAVGNEPHFHDKLQLVYKEIHVKLMQSQ